MTWAACCLDSDHDILFEAGGIVRFAPSAYEKGFEDEDPEEQAYYGALWASSMTGEAMARVALKGGESLYVKYTREEILGEYDFSVEGGSTQPINDTIRKQQAVSLMNAIAPLIGTVIDPTALAMHVLEEGFDVKDPMKFLVQQAQPATPEEQAVAGETPMPPQQPMPPEVPPVPIPQGPDLGAFAPTGGVPPELLAQLQNQMGLELPAL